VVKKIQEGYRPVMIACGSASYCGLAAHYLFAQVGIDSLNIGAYEFHPFAPLITQKSIVFAISQSGETADTLIAVREAKKRGALIVAVANAQGTTLERLADYVLPVGAGPEIAVVSTKAFTAQVATFFALVAAVRETKHTTFIEEFSAWINNDQHNETILQVAKKLVAEEHVYVIGKHINYPAALEFALKLKESSYLHAEAFASGELKHGVISLIQPGTSCVVLTANDETQGEVISSAIQLKSRGGTIIGVGPKSDTVFTTWIQTPDSGPDYAVFYNVVVGQLLGYYLGIGRGADPDKPRNLAKSVTVK
jgi:glucosamine--fructose-6-phosphate aminotransferase (isomerizing)